MGSSWTQAEGKCWFSPLTDDGNIFKVYLLHLKSLWLYISDFNITFSMLQWM